MQPVICGASPAVPHVGYQRRRPDTTTLYKVVLEHLETLYAEAEQAYPEGGGYPKYVKEEFEGYLRCGILQHGFARQTCKSCACERLVAYSCKGRGLCPSCIAKRSALTAAIVVDEVLPVAPYRQWTLSLPYALRYRLFRDTALFSRVLSVFVRTVFAWQRQRAKQVGVCGKMHTGSITHVQRYDSLLKANPHAHTWMPDGVFVEGDDGELTFHRLDAPTDQDVAWLCGRIRTRVLRCIDEDAEEDLDEDEVTIAAAQAETVQSPLPIARVDQGGDVPRASAPLAAFNAGFSLHAGLVVKANDRKSLERLLRYGSRPPFAQKRLSITPSGKVRLKLRKRYYTGQTAIVLEPVAFLKRLAAIVPPPRWHLSRYHGIFSSHHKARGKLKALLPKQTPTMVGTGAHTDEDVPAADLPPRMRYPYAVLLSRVFGADLGACHNCGGKMKLIACIDDPPVVAKILSHLGLSSDPPQKAPARSPPQLELGDWDMPPDDDDDLIDMN